MSATFRFDDARILKAIRKGAEDGIRAIAIVFEGEVMRMLSKPGTGRVYLLRRKTKSSAIKMLRRRADKKLGIRGSISRGEAASLLKQLQTERKAKGLRGRGGTLRRFGLHKASAPGQPPAVDTGTLRRSWQSAARSAGKTRPQLQGSRMRAEIGSPLVYARPLEFGRGAMKPRPYLRPSAARVQPKAQDIFIGAIRRAMAGLNA